MGLSFRTSEVQKDIVNAMVTCLPIQDKEPVLPF